MTTRLTGPVAGTIAIAVLVAAAPTPLAALDTLATAATAADPVAPLVAVVALVAWALAGWLLVVAAGALAARLPGTPGRVADTVARRVAPAGVRRLVEVALGLTMAAGVLGAAPASASPAIPPAPPAATSTLDWPNAATPTAATPTAATPTAATPTAATPTAATPTAAQAVVVRPGDSLWSVAADHLPAGATDARIAQAWPTWWAANRDAVGADPDLIHPDLELHPPTP